VSRLLLTLLLLSTPSIADTLLPVDAPAHRTVEYQEVWRTDAYSDEYLMGNIVDVVVDTEGNFYFLDSQLQEVFKFDSAGLYIDTVAHKGEGPGELNQVRQMGFWPPDTLILPQGFPARINRLDTHGMPLDELRVYRTKGDDTQASVQTLLPAGELAVVMGSIFIFDPEGARSINWIGVIDRTGTVLHEFGDKERQLSADPMHQVFDETDSFWDWNRWALSEDGRLYRVPNREEWLIEEYDLEGNLVSTMRREIGARPRTAAETEELKQGQNFIFNGRKSEVTFKLLDTEPPINVLTVINDQLWVLHNPADGELPDDVWRRISVVSLDGELIEELDLKIGHDPDLDTVELLPDGRLMVIENGVAATQAALAAFGIESDEEELDAEPAEIVIYEPLR
jgi:hypothetical protein